MQCSIYASRCDEFFDDIKKLISPEDIELLRERCLCDGWEAIQNWLLDEEEDVVLPFVSASSSGRTVLLENAGEDAPLLILAALNHVHRAQKVLYLLGNWYEGPKVKTLGDLVRDAGVFRLVLEIPSETKWYFDPPDPFAED